MNDMPDANMYKKHNIRNNNMHSVPVKRSLSEEVIQYGLHKASKSGGQTFVLAIFAGAFIALAFIFYITVTTGTTSTSWGVTRLLGGLAFSLGLMLVVLCGAELFTSTVLTSLAWAHGLINYRKMLTGWLYVFAGNIVGAIVILTLVLLAQMYNLHDAEWGMNALHIAQHKLHHGWWQAFALGILCNLLVCLGVWMSLSSKDSFAKAFLLMLPVAMFVSCGFEHSVANLFMVPLGISIRFLVEHNMFYSAQIDIATLADLSIKNFLFHNLIPVILGNITGGILLIGLAVPFNQHSKASQPISNNSFSPLTKSNYSTMNSLTIQGDFHMNTSILCNKKVADVMRTKPMTFPINMDFSHILIALADTQLAVVPVVDDNGNLQGMIDEQDVLRQLWANDFTLLTQTYAANIMHTDGISITPEISLAVLIETMSVDREKLYPVNADGMLISAGYNNFEQRLKNASTNTPSAIPVVEDGRLLGMIYRNDVLAFIRHEFGLPVNQDVHAAA